MFHSILDAAVGIAAILGIFDYFGIKPKGLPEWRTSRRSLAIMLILVAAALGMSGYDFYHSLHPKIVEKVVTKTVEKPVPIPCPEATPETKPTRPKAPSSANQQQSGKSNVQTGSITQGCGSIQQGGTENKANVNCGPPPLVLTIASIDTPGTAFVPKDGFIKTEITIVPNQEVTAPFTIALEFDNPISEIGHTVKNLGAQMGGGPYTVGTHARETVSTSIGPSHPLVVVVFSLQTVKLVAAPKIDF